MNARTAERDSKSILQKYLRNEKMVSDRSQARRETIRGHKNGGKWIRIRFIGRRVIRNGLERIEVNKSKFN